MEGDRMLKRKRIILLAFLMIFLSQTGIQAFGARKISKVSITVTSNFKIGEVCLAEDVEVSTNSKYFSVGEVTLVTEEERWGIRDVPVIEVSLEAEEGSYFSIAEVTDIQLKGAEYIAGTREDADTLILRLRLPSLRNQVGEIAEVQWASVNMGGWTEAYNTGYYEVRLFRDEKGVGSIQETTSASFDFSPWMTRSGMYTYEVRAVNVQNKSVKTDWKKSATSVFVDETMAKQFKAQYGMAIPTDMTDPGQAIEWQKQQQQKQQQAGWFQDSTGWWYRNPDHSYTTNNWQLIDGKWYYFNSSGYRVTGWVDWEGKSYYCDSVSGEKLTNMIVPDGSGRRVDSTGAMIE